MKGFIEVTILTDYPTNPKQQKTASIAVGAIVGLVELPKTCLITLAHPLNTGGNSAGSIIRVEQDYSEVCMLISNAQ